MRLSIRVVVRDDQYDILYSVEASRFGQRSAGFSFHSLVRRTRFSTAGAWSNECSRLLANHDTWLRRFMMHVHTDDRIPGTLYLA